MKQTKMVDCQEVTGNLALCQRCSKFNSHLESIFKVSVTHHTIPAIAMCAHVCVCVCDYDIAHSKKGNRCFAVVNTKALRMYFR